MLRCSLLGLASLALFATGCSSAPSLEGIQTVAPNTLTVCTNTPYEPFEFTKDGKLQGIDIDLMNAVAEHLDTTATFRETKFDVIFDDMNARACDMVASSVSITDERKRTMSFSNGYFEINQSLLVRGTDATQYATLSALADKRVGVQSGTTGEAYVTAKAPQATRVAFDDAGTMQAALAKGEIDAIVQDSPVNAYGAQTDPSLRVTQTFVDVDREEYGFAFPTASTALRNRVNEALGDIRNGGEYETILSRYLGTSNR